MRTDLSNKLASSKSDLWGTPPRLAKKLIREFDLRVDAAADAANTKCPSWMGPGGVQENALTVSWVDTFPAYPRFFLNPPFSLLSQFAHKALAEMIQGALTVAVPPVKSETPWWHAWTPVATEIRFLKGRLAHWRAGEDGTYVEGDSAFFPSAVVVWDGRRPAMQTSPRISWWDWRVA